MKPLPKRRVRVKSIHSLPLFEWADRNPRTFSHISPLARQVHRKWGYSPETAKAVVEAWGFDGGHDND